MERIVLFSCVLSVLIYTVQCQDELAIDFIMQRTDNSTYSVPEVMVDSARLERLQIMCRINNIPAILEFHNINFYRLKNGNVEHLATMQPRYSTSPGYQRPELMPGSAASMQAVGVFSKTNPSIGISIPVASLTCNDGLMYNCSFSYDVSQGSVSTKTSFLAKNLTVSVQPMNMELRAFNESSSFSMNEIIGSGIDSNTMASFMVGQVVKLTCKASLGTRSNGLIYWRKSNIVAGSGLASYIPNQGQHEEGQVTANGCHFEKMDSILYNTTEQDTTRSASNPLQFQCYISVPSSSYLLPEATVKNFYIKVQNVHGGPETGGLATAGSGDAGVIAGAVIGSLVGIVIIVLLVYFLWYRRRAAGEDYTTKEEQGASNPNLAPEPHYTESTKKGKENKALDEPHEPSGRYANEFYDNRNGNRGRKNKAMDYDDDDYHSRDGSPTMNHSTHMGVDPVHGSIGTGV